MNTPIWINCDSPHQGHWVEPNQVRDGLAITNAVDSTGDLLGLMFSITHVPSGLRIGDSYESDIADRLLAALLPLTDWTKSRDEILVVQGLEAAVERVLIKWG